MKRISVQLIMTLLMIGTLFTASAVMGQSQTDPKKAEKTVQVEKPKTEAAATADNKANSAKTKSVNPKKNRKKQRVAPALMTSAQAQRIIRNQEEILREMRIDSANNKESNTILKSLNSSFTSFDTFARNQFSSLGSSYAAVDSSLKTLAQQSGFNYSVLWWVATIASVIGVVIALWILYIIASWALIGIRRWRQPEEQASIA